MARPLIFDMYPRPQKANDWSVKSLTMQRSLVRAVRADIKRRTGGMKPEETKELDKWTYDSGGIYCGDWPEVTVKTPVLAVDMAALHLPHFIEAIDHTKIKKLGHLRKATVHTRFHALVVTPTQLTLLRKAAEAMRAEAARLMDEFNAKADPMTRAISEKKANKETVLVGPDGLIDVPQGRN